MGDYRPCRGHEDGTSDLEMARGQDEPTKSHNDSLENPTQTPCGPAKDGCDDEKPHSSGSCEANEAQSLECIWHRASWLIVLLMLQSTSSFVLKRFQLLVQLHPAVVFYLTMLVGAGGNAGAQSTILSIRKLTLNAKTMTDSQMWRDIMRTEARSGVLLAVLLGGISLIRCTMFQTGGQECLAIGLSMLAIVFSSTIVGAAFPLLLHRLGVDPAHAGAAIQVTMDIMGVSATCIVSCWVLGVPFSGDASLVELGDSHREVLRRALENATRTLNGTHVAA